MQWFKMLWLNSDEREILRAAKEKKDAPVTPTIVAPVEVDNGRPYKNIFYSNRNLTVVFKDGNVFTRANATPELFNSVQNASSAKQVEDLMIDTTKYQEPVIQDTKIETAQERQLVSDNLDVFKGKADFEIKGRDVFLKGVNLAMPAPVIASFIEILERIEGIPLFHQNAPEAMGATNKLVDYQSQLEALKMFWLKLALNTLPQSREDLLVFCRKNNVRITRNGNLILYRRIVSKTGADTKFVTFVTQQYYRLKKEFQDTRNFGVARWGDDYGLVDLRDYVGTGPEPFVNLQVAYLELPTFDTNTFTSAHDNKVDIRIGGIYKIPDSKINLNNSICATGGLHAAAVDYDYSGFGDLAVVVLVNPSKAITVPMGETGKLRTTEMFIACVNDKPIGQHFDESALSAFDSEYHDLTLGELEEAAKSKSFEKLSVQDTVPAVSLVDLNTIKDMLKNRVKTVN